MRTHPEAEPDLTAERLQIPERPPDPWERVRESALDLARRPGALRMAGLALAAVVVAGAAGLAWTRGAPPDADLPMATAAVAGDGAEATSTPTPATAPSAPPGDPGPAGQPEPPGELHAHVAGAVNEPGLVILAPDARVSDLIEAGGGPRPDADLHRVNLAAPVADGTRLYVPAEGETDLPAEVSPSGGGPGTPSGDDQPALVPVNSANAEELEDLPGVGPATAEAIVSHREQNGPFATVGELEAVRGIGPAKLEALADHVAL